jgi:hypothetical protein
LASVSLAALAGIGLVTGLWAVRRLLLARRAVTAGPTWDCGYVRPNARMQYTATSFVQPTTALFHQVTRTHQRLRRPDGYFPVRAAFVSHTPDLFGARVYRPAWRLFTWWAARLRWLQQGRVHAYLLYILITVSVLLVWRVGFSG